MELELVSSLVLTALLTAVLVRHVRGWLLRRGWVDAPDGVRKHHLRATPRLGGLAMGAGMAAGGAFLALTVGLGSLLPLAAGAAGFWLLGLYDDLWALGFKRKFFIQILLTFGVLLGGWRLDVDVLPGIGWLDGYNQVLVAGALAFVWIVGVVNALNLLDGVDGLAAGVSLIAFVSLGGVFALTGQLALLGVCMVAVGALGAFLVYNWTPASIFMGDAGSFLLGFLLAALSLKGIEAAPASWGLFLPVVALGLPILDTLSCIVRRIAAGQSPFMPDSDHIHHRVVRAMRSVREGVLVLYAIAVAFGALSVLMVLLPGDWAAVPGGLALLMAYGLLRRLDYLPHARRGAPRPPEAPAPVAGWQVEGDGAQDPAVVRTPELGGVNAADG